jgi:hypothetical protein
MCRSTGESKRYNQILIQLIPGGEDGLRDVFEANLDLMVTRMEIDLQKDLRIDKLIKKMSMWGNGYLFLMVMTFKGQ